MGVKGAIRQVLTKQLNKRYEKQLSLRKISYDAWMRETERDRAAECSCGGFVLLVQRAGRLNANALEEITAYFAAHPEVMLLYGDEDLMLADGTRINPWYKPCWSPDLYGSYFYLGSVIAVRRALYERVAAAGKWRAGNKDPEEEAFAGDVVGEGLAWDAAQGNADDTDDNRDYIEFTHVEEIQELVHRLVTEAGGFQKGCNAIGHVEYVLFHGDSEEIWQEYRKVPDQEACQLHEEMPDTAPGDAGQDSGTAQGDAGQDSGAAREGAAPHSVSIIIPSKDNPQVLHTCLQSLHLGKHTHVEVIVVDNGSSPENKAKVQAMLEELPKGTARYLYQPMEFNFSRMCNLGAEHAAPDNRFLLFLNDDMEMCDNDWLEVMADAASKEYAGAVGLKLYYPDSVRIQHAGIVNLPVGPVHKLQFMEDDREYYFGRNRGRVNCVAVTGACLMIEKTKFDEAGRFKESLRVAYNDVELGFALLELGYQNVVINDCYGYHHESLSRGNDETKEKLRRLEQERELLYQLHPAFRGNDPYYPAGLNRQGLDSRVVPGYVTDKNTVQANAWTAFPYQPESLRWDACLMARVESSGPELIQGYSVVLGDNNACYEKYLVLIPEAQGSAAKEAEAAGAQSDVGTTWYMKLEGQYRQDLEENLPDQVNVALGGFCVSRKDEQLPEGNYRIAVLAVNRISGLKLINESGKYLEAE